MSVKLIQAANKLLGETVPGVKDILSIGISLARTAAKIPGMKGVEKMDAVLSCLREILAGPIKEKLTAEELQVLHTTVDVVLPTAINLMIDASRAGDFVKKNMPAKIFCVPCCGSITKETAVVVAPAAPVSEPASEPAAETRDAQAS